MARVAYVMNDIMDKLGLSGKSFYSYGIRIWMYSSSYHASRTLESKKDRERVMLITPFMSCSAKLPVYILFSGMFFGKYAMFAAYSMYIIGIFDCAFGSMDLT